MEYAQTGPLGGTEGAASADDFHPRYIYTPRLVGRLACGELAIEPALGPVRVVTARVDANGHSGAGIDTGTEGHVFVRWRDEHGPSSVQGRYPADRSFDVRMPAHPDRLLIRQAIDRARRHNREITDDTARLIAAHLHAGKKSALHGFMIDGHVDELLYDELDLVSSRRRYARDWVDALARYCLACEDCGPIPAWTRQAVTEGEARAEEWLRAAGVKVDQLVEHANCNGRDRINRHPNLLAKKNIKTETAVQLIEAAFFLGLEARRAGKVARELRRDRDQRHKPNRAAA